MRREKYGNELNYARALSALMVAAITLIVFVGIAPAEAENRSITTEVAQSMDSSVIYAYENFIENTFFEIKVLQGNERLGLPEKRMVDASQERSKGISLRIVSKNNKGLKVSSFSKNATEGTSGVLNVLRSSVTEEWKPSKLPPSVDMLKLGEEVALGNALTNEHSRFAEPDLWVGTGADQVPGTTETAYDIANDYKPGYITELTNALIQSIIALSRDMTLMQSLRHI